MSSEEARACVKGEEMPDLIYDHKSRPEEFIKKEDINDENYPYCEVCKSHFHNNCEVRGSALFVPDAPAPPGVADRAGQTLPPGLEIEKSTICDAGLGVFNKGEMVPVGVHFGPCQVEPVDGEDDADGGYSWTIRGSGQSADCVASGRKVCANWTRYVRRARNKGERNLVASKDGGAVLYRCCRPIDSGQELLVWDDDDDDDDDDGLMMKEESGGLAQTFSATARPLSRTSRTDLDGDDRTVRRENHLVLRGSEKTREVQSQTASDSSHGETQPELRHCSTCGRSFKSRDDFEVHRCCQTGDGPHRCSQCGKTFNQKCSLRKHRRVHTGEKPHNCAQCGKSFVYRFDLQQHLRTHTGEKPYDCTQCGKSFNQRNHLRIHRRVHTGEKPYRCSECGRSFTQKSNFNVHRRVHTGEKPYRCSECGKSFGLRRNLQLHRSVHTGEKPFYCSECGKSFAHQSTLYRHRRVHTGEKPYYCERCDKCFNHQSHLQRHQSVHTGEKPYRCGRCGKGFSRQRSIGIHRCVGAAETFQPS